MAKPIPAAASGFARRNSSIADCCDLKYSSCRYWTRSSAKNAAIRPRTRAATSNRRRDMVRAASGRARESARPHGLLHLVPRTGSDALAIRERGGRACGADAVESRHPRFLVGAHGDGFADDRAQPRAVERLRRGHAPDAPPEAETRVAEIRHSGGAVVDDERLPARRVEFPHHRQAGMRTRKYVDAGAGEHGPAALGMVAQCFLRELPAGERFRVAVRDADAQAPDFSDKVHGQ